MKNFEAEAFVLMEEKKLKRLFWVWVLCAAVDLPVIWYVMFTDKSLHKLIFYFLFLASVAILLFVGYLWHCYRSAIKDWQDYEKMLKEQEEMRAKIK